MTEPNEFDEFRQRQERQERRRLIAIRVMDVLTVLALRRNRSPGPEDDLLLEPNVVATHFESDTAWMAPRLSQQARRALIEISSHPRGAAEEFLTLSGFNREMLSSLVLAGFITVVTETIQAGTSTIKVERYRITDDGRKAIEG